MEGDRDGGGGEEVTEEEYEAAERLRECVGERKRESGGDRERERERATKAICCLLSDFELSFGSESGDR